MAININILTTLEYLGQYSTASGRSAYCGLILTVAADPNTTIDDNVKPFLQPWTWTVSSIMIWEMDENGANYHLLKAVELIFPQNLKLDPHITANLENEFGRNKGSDFCWTDPQNKTTANPEGVTNVNSSGSGYPWPAHLGQVARYPYPISHLLNLAYVIKVGSQDGTFPFTPQKDKTYAAAVQFQTSQGQTFKPMPTQSSFTDQQQGRVYIPFDRGPATTYTQLLKAADALGAASDRIVILGDPELFDWQAHMVPGVADLFDLSARFIRPVRSACDTSSTTSDFKNDIAGDFGAFCMATINAQRDVISYGCGLAPDGSSLLQQILDKWTSEMTEQELPSKLDFVNDFSKAVANARSSETDDLWQEVLINNPELQNYSILMSPPPSVDPLHLSDKLIPLEHLQLRLSQNDMLSQLLLFQWDAVYDKNKTQSRPINNLYQSFRSTAVTTMDTLNLRGILQQGSLEKYWPLIVPSVSQNDKQVLRTNLQTQLRNKFNDRFSAASSCAIAAIAATLQANDPWINQQIEALVPFDVNALPTRMSEGISFVVDTLNAFARDTDSSDTLRRMVGYCVLMRDVTQGADPAWRCLNVAFPMTWPCLVTDPKCSDSTAVVAVQGLTDPAVVPVPQHIQSQMRRAILTYNNQPLMAESPAHTFGEGLMQSDASAERLISFVHPSVTTPVDAAHPTWKIPGLIFGHSYQLLIGRVSNCGALPPSFARSNNPALLDFKAVESAYAAQNTSGLSTAVAYLRTVPVGDLRFAVDSQGRSATSLSKLTLPLIPPDVQPRTREIYPTTPDNQGSATAPSPTTPPLILLSSYADALPRGVAKNNFILYVQKPAIDLQTWDRWKAIVPSNMQERIDTWTRFHQLARQQRSSNDLSIDDPAVQQLQVSINVTDMDGAIYKFGNDSVISKVWSSPAMSAPGEGIVQNSAPPVPLIINAGTSSSFDNATWTLTLAPGSVAKITLAPLLVQGAATLFAKGISQGVSYDIFAEAASSAMPSILLLQSAFTVAAPSDSAGNSVDFSLPLAKLSGVGSQIRRATLVTQVWRWNGRPLPLFPFSANVDTPDPAVLEWEVNAFATRLATDVGTRPMNPVTVIPEKFSEPKTLAFVAQDDITTLPGTSYYRSGLEAYNRYGSLVPESARSVSTLDPATSTLPGGNGGWHRTLVRARLTNKVLLPKPAIKFIVPLTGTLPSGTAVADGLVASNRTKSAAASALVVVQGPWYSIGGLAEDLEVMIVPSGKDSSSPGTPEVGPDPIIWHGRRSDLPKKYANYDQDNSGKRTDCSSGKPTDCLQFASADQRLHGPVGHTFDLSDTNPLWANTSFILDPPPPVGADAAPWTFAEVAFRRTIHKEGLTPPSKKTGVTSPNNQENFCSEWTEARWVQFLPSRFSGLGKSVDLADCRVTRADKNTFAIFDEKKNKPIQLIDNTGDANLFFALLLTQQVSDLLGRKGQERFFRVLVVRADNSVAAWKVDESIEDQAGLIGRILAIQRNPIPSAPAIGNQNQLWIALFPESGDAMARIVGVSPAIVPNATSCSPKERN